MNAHNPAILWGTRRITWVQLDQYCVCVISQLKNIGIKPGDRVAICAPASAEYLIVLFSLWRMKAVACPVSPHWPSQAVNEYLSRIKAGLFLTTAHIKQAMHTVGARSLYLNEVVCFDARRESSGKIQTWQPDLEQEATVIATSGSSNQPKPAVHSWGNHYYNALGSQQLIALDAQDRWLLSLPLYHVSGMAIVVRCFLAGAAIVLPGEDDMLQSILKRQVTHVSLVSTQLYRLLSAHDVPSILKSLKCILLGGSAIPSALLEKVKSLGLNAYVSYGLTEMSSQVATGKVGGCIKVLPYRELSISSEGEILVKGPTLFKGYIQSGHVHLPLTEQGWFKTGDLGRLDNQGCLTVLGRRDHMFISGGENIQPEEVEKVLLSMPGIMEAVVVPKEDKEFGHRPVAFLKFCGEALASECIIRHCEQFLPKFKIPVQFYPWPDQLMHKSIKISRKDLQGNLPR